MCDCAVALGSETARGATLFGKNSDREALEPQPLRSLAAAEHAPRSSVRCTHVAVAQVRETASVLGTGPAWCWGLEQGVNEHGVAIGNELVMTHEELELGEPGLIGMDLVRLGLERARSAREAVETLARLVERFGQGGQAFMTKPIAYSNGFLIADPTEAWSLQTSSHRWVARRVDGIQGIGSLSNHVSIGSDWELASEDAERFAIERGWWSPERGRLDFEAAYRSTRLLPAAASDGRLARSHALLAAGRGTLQETDLFRILRDHGPRAVGPPADDPEDDARFTLCAHNDLQGDTTASMALSLDRNVRWFALGAPCASVYLPLAVGAKLPAVLTSSEEDSAWWRFKRLQQQVERDFDARLPRVRDAFDPLEAEWLDATNDPGWGADPAGIEEAAARALERCDALLRALAS